MHRLVIITTNN